MTFRQPSLHIQNVIARRQCETIISIFVRRYTRDLFFPVLTQDDQRIFCIISAAELWRIPLGKLNIFNRMDPQMSFEETQRSVIRGRTADRNQTEASQTQILEPHDVKKNGRDRFSLSRPSYKSNVTAASTSRRCGRAL